MVLTTAMAVSVAVLLLSPCGIYYGQEFIIRTMSGEIVVAL